ncbi:MAG: hypothetical protein ACJ77A_06570 [Actinomycetota bacterium]
MSWVWVLLDGAESETGRSEEFDDREVAEAWMGERWPDLAASGVQLVALLEDGDEAYRMSLEAG